MIAKMVAAPQIKEAKAGGRRLLQTTIVISNRANAAPFKFPRVKPHRRLDFCGFKFHI